MFLGLGKIKVARMVCDRVVVTEKSTRGQTSSRSVPFCSPRLQEYGGTTPFFVRSVYCKLT